MAKVIPVTEKQMVLFELGTETYGLDIATVHEIIRMQPITKVPKAPFYVEGVINLRGRVIPVIDIGKKFGFEKTEEAKNNRIVVIKIKDTTLGIIVDAVTEVIRVPVESIDPVSDIVTSGQSDYLMGIAKLPDKMVIILALDKLLSKDEELVDIALNKKAVKTESASTK
jgi:purine-binding chemotaxis protein CheW